jgi:hypothetical protein
MSFRRACEQSFLDPERVVQACLPGDIHGLGPEIIRGRKGLDIVSAEVVEVSPSYDQAVTTALVAANLAYEMLCILPGLKHRA